MGRGRFCGVEVKHRGWASRPTSGIVAQIAEDGGKHHVARSVDVQVLRTVALDSRR